MLFRQMKYFVAIVDCGSFTEAAERCYVSQSAISQQMSALEAELGVKLFERDGRKFRLTPAGDYFYGKRGHCSQARKRYALRPNVSARTVSSSSASAILRAITATNCRRPSSGFRASIRRSSWIFSKVRTKSCTVR